MGPEDKLKNWSDGLGQRAHSSDMVHNLNDLDALGVDENIVERGIVLMGDCPHCGRQWKVVVTWPEVAMIYTGQVPNIQPPPWVPTRQGVFFGKPCRCTLAHNVKPQPLQIDWNDVAKWVDSGIRSGVLDRGILRVGIVK